MADQTMNALSDSQLTANSQSQDLFDDNVGTMADDHQDRIPQDVLTEATGRRILEQLQSISNRLCNVEADIGQIKKGLGSAAKSFNIQNCSFKKKFSLYLREKFSRNPWLDSQDPEFKTHIQRLLRSEGQLQNHHAYKEVLAFAYSKYSDLRNQLRRKILAEDKQDLRAMKAEDFCRKLFSSHCNAGEDICIEQRMHLTLLLRSYLHKKKYFEEGGGDNQFWTEMKEYYLRNGANTEAEWEKRREIDNRRLRNYLSEREKNTQGGNQTSTS